MQKQPGCRKLVFSSSATVYGEPDKLPLDERSSVGVGITNPYGACPSCRANCATSRHGAFLAVSKFVSLTLSLRFFSYFLVLSASTFVCVLCYFEANFFLLRLSCETEYTRAPFL